jgi:hypothetical protein
MVTDPMDGIPTGRVTLGRDADLFVHAGLAFGGEGLEPLASAPMTEEQVLSLAQAMTGLDDWGTDDSFLVGLRVLVEAIEAMEPSARWRHSFRRQIVHFLSQRLRLREDERLHPGLVEQQIEAPVLIVGIPRTGTTLTHDLLALDPSARAPRNWEYAAPWPAPEVASFATDPRIAKVNASWKAQLEASPELAAMLPMDANMPSECNDSMMFHFAGPNYWAWMRVPEHRRWTGAQTAPGLYGTHKRILQELQWKGPRGRWTLKSPGFIGDLSAIVDTYPDARLVWTHRDPATTIASLSSLVAALQNALLGERPDPVELGKETRELWVACLKRGMAARDDPRVDSAVIDIPYRELVADKVGTTRRIHDHFGLGFTDEHRQAIEALEVVQPSSQFAKHAYSTEDFGVDVASLRDELSDYYDRYGDLV